MAQQRFGQSRFYPLRAPLAFGEQQALTGSPIQQAVAQLKAATPPAPGGPNPGMLGALKQKRKRGGLGAFYGQ